MGTDLSVPGATIPVPASHACRQVDRAVCPHFSPRPTKHAGFAEKLAEPNMQTLAGICATELSQ